MRKFLYFGLAALMLGFLSTACVDPIDSAIVDEGKKVDDNSMVFRASLEQLVPETKTALTPSNSVVWSEGDQIRIYNLTHPAGEVYTLKSGDGGKVDGSFSGPEIGPGPYFAVYPASAGGEISFSLPMASLNVSVPQSQTYAGGSFSNGANISWAYADTKEGLSFHNVFGAVSFTLKGTATIKKINLYTRGTDILNGTATLSMNTTDPTTLDVSYSKGTLEYLTLDCGAGITLNEVDGVTFCLSVPAGTFADGFYVEFIDTDEKAMIKSAKGSNANKIERGVIRVMPAFSYLAQYNGDFLSFNPRAGAWTGVTSGKTISCGATYYERETGSEAGQYAIIPGTDYTVRIQNWFLGYALTMTVPNPLPALGEQFSLTVNAMGDTGEITGGVKTVKVIKKTSDRIWMVEKTNGNGYIIQQ